MFGPYKVETFRPDKMYYFCIQIKCCVIDWRVVFIGFTFPDIIYVAYRMLYWISEMNFNCETCLAADEQIIE